MIKPSGSSTGLRPVHGATMVVAAVLAVVIAYAAFGFIVCAVAFLVKLAIVVAVIALVVKLVLRRAAK